MQAQASQQAEGAGSFSPPEWVQGKEKMISAEALRGKRSRPLEAERRDRPSLLAEREGGGVPARGRGPEMRE